MIVNFKFVSFNTSFTSINCNENLHIVFKIIKNNVEIKIEKFIIETNEWQ
jgi:hypothetical protein